MADRPVHHADRPDQEVLKNVYITGQHVIAKSVEVVEYVNTIIINFHVLLVVIQKNIKAKQQ